MVAGSVLAAVASPVRRGGGSAQGKNKKMKILTFFPWLSLGSCRPWSGRSQAVYDAFADEPSWLVGWIGLVLSPSSRLT